MNVNLKAVPMVNLTVAMANVSMAHGHVTDLVTVLMAQMKPTVHLKAVPMVNLHVLMDLVSMAAGHETAMVTALMAQMKPTVNLKAVLMVNLTVAMDLVSMAHGHVTAMVTVLMAVMKLTVLLHHVKTKVYGIVVMASVSQQVMYVMAQVNFVMQAGVLTVPMAQMKA